MTECLSVKLYITCNDTNIPSDFTHHSQNNFRGKRMFNSKICWLRQIAGVTTTATTANKSHAYFEGKLCVQRIFYAILLRLWKMRTYLKCLKYVIVRSWSIQPPDGFIFSFLASWHETQLLNWNESFWIRIKWHFIIRHWKSNIKTIASNSQCEKFKQEIFNLKTK